MHGNILVCCRSKLGKTVQSGAKWVRLLPRSIGAGSLPSTSVLRQAAFHLMPSAFCLLPLAFRLSINPQASCLSPHVFCLLPVHEFSGKLPYTTLFACTACPQLIIATKALSKAVTSELSGCQGRASCGFTSFAEHSRRLSQCIAAWHAMRAFKPLRVP